jgi:hypothetical protein
LNFDIQRGSGEDGHRGVAGVGVEPAGRQGALDRLRFIHEVVWKKYNPTLKIRGILPTMYKKITTHSAGVVDKAREIWGDKVFAIEVPEAISFPRAYTAGLPLLLFDPQHEGSLAYLAVARLLYTAPERPQAMPEPGEEAPADQGQVEPARPLWRRCLMVMKTSYERNA